MSQSNLYIASATNYFLRIVAISSCPIVVSSHDLLQINQYILDNRVQLLYQMIVTDFNLNFDFCLNLKDFIVIYVNTMKEQCKGSSCPKLVMDCHDQNIPLKTSSSGFKGCSGALIELATGEMPAGDKVSSSSIDFLLRFLFFC